MAKKEKEKKPKVVVHKCKRHNVEANTWRLACGVKLNKEERKNVTIADDWQYVSCRSCKKEKPDG